MHTQTQIQAFHQTKEVREGQKARMLRYLQANPTECYSDRELSIILRIGERQAGTRRKELQNVGKVICVGTDRCTLTMRSVQFYQYAENGIPQPKKETLKNKVEELRKFISEYGAGDLIAMGILNKMDNLGL
jgi:hypothetical protein